MGFIGSVFGGSSGDNGAAGLNFSADKANILQPTNTAQTDQAYNSSQQALAQQQAMLQALQAQNGIGNQSNVFGQQQMLANQLQGVANGTGPNPALQQLQNTTGQNVANQAALMAGQRGSGANAGLLARQAAMQGANTQQQAAGQGAALAAQQQLSGMSALQQQQAQMANLAGTQVGQQQAALAGYNNAAQSEQGALLGAMQGYNNANVGMQSNVNNANAGISNTAAQGQQAMFGGIEKGLGSALSLAKGGQVPAQHFDEGGMAYTPDASKYNLGNVASQVNDSMGSGPQSFAGKFMSEEAPMAQNNQAAPAVAAPQFSSNNPGADAIAQGTGSLASFGSSGVKSMIGGSQDGGSGGGGMASMLPMLAMAFQKGGHVDGEMLAAQGKVVPGKAKVKGDSLKNDVVNAKLSPGEIVIPRHIATNANAPEMAKKFVAAVLAKQGMGKK